MNIYMETLVPDNPAIPVRCWRVQGRRNYDVHSSHWHKLMEIVYTKQGNAIQQLSQTFYSVSPGQLSVICPDQLHSYAAASSQEEFDLIVLQFDVDFVVKRVPSTDAFGKDWLSGTLLFTEPVEASPQAVLLMENILSEMTNRKEGYIHAVTGALLELLVLLYRTSPVRIRTSEPNAAMDQCRKLLSDTFRLVNEHYQEELSVRQAADNANLSVSHFCRLFKQTTGIGFHEYLLRYRLAHAEQLFSTDRTLCDIALSCGFGSLSSFTRAFRKWRGYPPGHVRKHC